MPSVFLMHIGHLHSIDTAAPALFLLFHSPGTRIPVVANVVRSSLLSAHTCTPLDMTPPPHLTEHSNPYHIMPLVLNKSSHSLPFTILLFLTDPYPCDDGVVRQDILVEHNHPRNAMDNATNNTQRSSHAAFHSGVIF